jgi:hypothetical protein
MNSVHDNGNPDGVLVNGKQILARERICMAAGAINLFPR